MPSKFAIIIPVQNEAECLGEVLSELKPLLAEIDRHEFVIAVGLNGCTDRSGEIATEAGVLVGESDRSGYGHGCLAAIDAALNVEPDIAAFVFYAGDGANDPRDIERLIDLYENGGSKFVMGLREFDL
ncbi:MAG: glycosyltransferase, partial [Verrucomicrobiales bacterium]|nr:glycosyltransferase [Verrucomicrobiales bacterium]